MSLNPLYETFQVWYAASLSNNRFTGAAATHRIENSGDVGEGENSVALSYCIPSAFTKRVTDVSQAAAPDITSPDTGTAQAAVTLRIVENRPQGRPAGTVLQRLLNMFYEAGSDTDFRKGRIGLANSDNPELDCLPTADAGYKLLGFMQHPNPDTPSTAIWDISLGFVGDHDRLGTR